MRIIQKGVFISSAPPSGEQFVPEKSIEGHVILTAEPGNTLSVYVSTDMAPSMKDQILAEAKGILEAQNDFADEHNIIRGTVIVCRTLGCAEMRERVDELFVFERQENSWIYNPDLSKGDDGN